VNVVMSQDFGEGKTSVLGRGSTFRGGMAKRTSKLRWTVNNFAVTGGARRKGARKNGVKRKQQL